jgi:DNA-binding transcriptional regulator YbjK
VVHAAIEILDADGEGALTFRALAHRLFTDSGAMYHYVADKDELLKAATQLFERIGEQLHALGVPARAQFDSASALVNDVLGLAGQYAAGARLLARDTDRTAFLGMVAAEWEELDRRDFPFMHRMADGLQ